MRNIKKIIPVLGLVALLALPFVVYAKAQAITDWWQLRGYTPPVAVSSLATEDTMTPYAKHVFYVNHPQITSSVVAFRQECSENEQTIVLGCYHPNQDGIDIYAVQDSRLHGVQEVTAAHEMLHAAYDRLSTKDKNYIDGLLENYYKNDLHDQRIITTINAYKKTEPGQVVNEMHSIFGTEIANLPPALETYYAKYFSNRAAITTLAANYQGAFTSLQSQIDSYDRQLATLKQQITDEEQSLQSQLSQLNADRSQLDAEKSSGQTGQYNAGVPAFNAEVDAYNAGITKLQSDIASYNSQVGTRNSIAKELSGLQGEIDTRLTTQPAQ